MKPRVSVLIAVYNAVRELELALTGYSRQSFRDFEIVIADDGSGPEMSAFVEEFSRRSSFPIQYVSQPDDGFRKCRILNEAIRVSAADYLIFADSDCIPHPRFVEAHFNHDRARTVLCGRRVNLSQRYSQSLTPRDILAGRLEALTPRKIVNALLGWEHHWEEAIPIGSQTLRNWINPRQPTLFGCNYSLPKSLLEEVNGFNEDFVDYWGEDTELEHRLHLANGQFQWVRFQAIQYHLYHPQRSPTQASCETLERVLSGRTAVCTNGLRKASQIENNSPQEGSLQEP